MYCIDSVERNGELIHFLNVENDGPVILLLHGFPDSAFGWDLQIEALKGDYHLIAPFMPGTLNNQDVPLSRLRGEELKKDVLAIIRKVQSEKTREIFIISHDLGSFISVSLARDLSGEVQGLIHLNGLGIEQFVDRKWQLSQWKKSYYVLLFQFKLVRTFISSIIPEKILKKVYDLSRLGREDRIRQNDARVLKWIGIYKHLFHGALRSLRQSSSRISAPTLFIWGKKDAFLNIPSMNEVEKFYSQGSVRILDGGHWVMRSHAEQVNRIIQKSLKNWERPV